MRTLRLVLGAGGIAVIGLGAWLLFFDTGTGTVPEVALWMAGSLLAHDLLLVPLVLLLGLLLRPRGVWRAGLVVGGCVTLVALPALLRPGAPRNVTALPLDYPRNWLLVLAAVAVVTAAVWLVRRRRQAA